MEKMIDDECFCLDLKQEIFDLLDSMKEDAALLRNLFTMATSGECPETRDFAKKALLAYLDSTEEYCDKKGEWLRKAAIR